MDNVKIKGTFIIFVFCLMVSCQTFDNRPIDNQLQLCSFDSDKWTLDTCGTNGYKKKVGRCIRVNSLEKVLFKNEKEVISYLGRPDTFFYHKDKSKTFLYIIDGTPSCIDFYPEGMLETLSVFINDKKEVTSISGGIH